MLRLIVASVTSMPLSSKKASQCSDKVRSGLDFSCSGSHCLKALPFTEGLPGILWIVTSPVRRLLLSQRLMVERETPKSSETSFLGMPRSIAESTFSLRSFEYAFMDLFLCRSAIYASRCYYRQQQRRKETSMSVVNKAVVRCLYEKAFGQGKPEVLEEVLNPDFVCYDPNAEGGEVRGLETTNGR
jgi:hypothetical protein